MKQGVIVPEITVNSDCTIFTRHSPLKMRANHAKKINGKLKKAGGITVGKRSNQKGLSAYPLNGSVKDHILLLNHRMPTVNVSNAINLCKKELKHEGKDCRDCKIAMDSNSCTKHKIAMFT